MPDAKVIALTGSTGFIGSHILNVLLTSNYRIRLLVRTASKHRINHPNIEVITGDLHNQSALNRLSTDADFIIHCAGRVRGASAQSFIHDNVTGTKNILSACARKNDCKFIHISSLSAREPGISDYANSKHESEAALKNSGIKYWTVIRPPAVYGPGDTELKPLFDWMKRGILWVPGSAKQLFSVLHVEDLSQLVLCQLNTGTVSKNIMEPDDGNIQHIGEQFFNRKVRIIRMPGPVLLLAAHSNVLFSTALNKSPMLTPGKVKELLHKNWVSKGETGVSNWKPKLDLKIGLGTLYSENEGK